MKKQKKVNVVFLPIFLVVSILFLSVGYAAINSITSEITGKVLAIKQDGIFITNVEYSSNLNANPVDSSINNYTQTTLSSSVVLSSTQGNSAITYAITVYNSTQDDYEFNDVLFGNEFYDNSNIVFGLTDLKKGDPLASKAYLTFYITFSYLDDIVASNNKLNSYLNFNFIKPSGLDLTCEATPTWPEGNYTFYLINCTLTNYSTENVKGWNVLLPFSSGYKYNSAWGEDNNIHFDFNDSNKFVVNSTSTLGVGKSTTFTIQAGLLDDNFDFDDAIINDSPLGDDDNAGDNNDSGDNGDTGDNDDSGDNDGSGDNGGTSDSGDSGNDGDTEDSGDSGITITTNGLEVALDEVNSWSAPNDGLYYYQYNVSVTNLTARDITDWQVAIDVPSGSAVNGWNLDFEVLEDAIIIKAPAYNNVLAAGATYSQGGMQLTVTVPNYKPILK